LINDQPGRILLDADGNTVGVVSVDIVADRIQTLRFIVNPDKLRHLQAR
jgi:RNA polymerase sigma-70 factor (ECF subfamily)